jgi:hypothetical protein
MENGPFAMPGAGNCEARIIIPISDNINQSRPNRANNFIIVQDTKYAEG